MPHKDKLAIVIDCSSHMNPQVVVNLYHLRN